MSSTPATKSHTAWWCLGAVILMPLLYVLSVPILLRCASVKAHPQELKYYKKQPQWIKDYCNPYIRALNSDTMLKKPLDTYTSLWGYKRNPMIARSEQLMEQARESMRKSQELRAKFEKLKQEMEERGKPWPERRGPVIPTPIPDTEPAPEPRGYESLLRKSS